MADATATKNKGAVKAGKGKYGFVIADLDAIEAGTGYSTSRGGVLEGERMQVGLIHKARGTGSRAHSHPNEQWIYVLEGTFRANIDGKEINVRPGSVVYIPANTVHAGKATADGDVVFFTVKDASHGLHGIKAT